MKYHIVWNGEVVASFKNEHQRKQVLAYWKERFSYAAAEITTRDD